MSFKLVGNLYVDKVFGSDTTGTGTKENPFFTVQKAGTMATTGQTIILGSGVYEEALTYGNKELRIIGEGTVLFAGSKLSDSTFGILAPPAYIENVNFFDYRGTSIVGLHTPVTAKIRNCTFNFCRVSMVFGGGDWKNNLFRHVNFASNGGFAGIWQNNTFDTCEGALCVVFQSGSMVNNVFRNCPGLTFAVPAMQPVNGEFDYNQIEDLLDNRTLAQWRAFASWTNANSYNLPKDDYLNDVEATRNDLEYWRNDYTLKPFKADGLTFNPLRNTGKFGRYIGAFPRGFKFPAAYLWANKASSSNLTFDAGSNTLKLDAGTGPLTGIIETSILPISDGGDESITFDALKIFQNIVWSLTAPGRAAQFIESTLDPAPNALVNQKTTYDIEAAFYTDNTNPTVWQKFEINAPIKQDNTGKGYAEPDFDATQQQLITANFVKFRLTFRRV